MVEHLRSLGVFRPPVAPFVFFAHLPIKIALKGAIPPTLRDIVLKHVLQSLSFCVGTSAYALDRQTLLLTWIFSRGASRGLYQLFFQERAKSGEIWLLPVIIEKQPFFKLQGGPMPPPLPTPMATNSTTWVLEVALSSVDSPVPPATATNLSRRRLHSASALFFFPFPSFFCST